MIQAWQDRRLLAVRRQNLYNPDIEPPEHPQVNLQGS